jgi:hypothetical protein
LLKQLLPAAQLSEPRWLVDRLFLLPAKKGAKKGIKILHRLNFIPFRANLQSPE